MVRLLTALAALSLCPPVARAEEPAPTAEEAPAPEGVVAPAWLLGDWKPLPPDEELRAQLAAIRLAFRDPPPTAAELAALREDDRKKVETLLLARKTDPDHPGLVKVREGLREADKVKMTFEADGGIQANVGPVQETRYRVLQVHGAVVRIAVQEADGSWTEGDIHRVAEDRIEMRNGDDPPLILVR